MGTFIEIQCLNGTVIKGESFLTCTESSTWDFPVPYCVDVLESRTKTTTITTSTFTEDETTTLPTWDTTMTSENVSMTTSIPVSSVPDISDMREFLGSLMKFLYHGCESPVNMSKLCELSDGKSLFSDLTHLNATHLNDVKDMDRKLASYLDKATFQLRKPNIPQSLNFQNMLNFILYGNTETDSGYEKMSVIDEGAYRLVLCFYIDAILNDKRLNMMAPTPHEDINDKIKRLLIYILTIVHDNFKMTKGVEVNIIEITMPVQSQSSSESESPTDDTTDSLATLRASRSTLENNELIATVNMVPSQLIIETTTDLMISTSTEPNEPSGCFVYDLPATPAHTSSLVTFAENKTLNGFPDNLTYAPVGTRVNYSCLPGYSSFGNRSYVQCVANETWDRSNITCQGS